MENQAKKQKPFYKKVWFIILAVLVLLYIIGTISGGGDKESSSTSGEATKSESTVKETPEVKSNWSYTEDEDKMTSEKRYFASCVSTNEIEFEFPYDGGSHFTLKVRNMGKGNDIVLQVSKGQFMPGIGSTEYCRVKFDDGETVNYTYGSAADGSADVIFLENSSKFLGKLKTAKKLMIEAPFYDAGRKVIESNVEGLTWTK